MREARERGKIKFGVPVQARLPLLNNQKRERIVKKLNKKK